MIWSEGVLIEGRILRPERRETFARKDGFDSWRDMRKTFQTMHGAGTFYGIVIEW